MLRKFFALIFLSGCFVITGADLYAQKSVRLYPSVIRVQRGKTKTVTAIAYDANREPVFNAPFDFTSSNPASVASLTPVLINNGDDISVQGTPPPNLRTVNGINAGTTTINASWSGVTSNPVTVVVDDPEQQPIAVVNGDNDELGGAAINTKVGEAIELSADASRGVDKIEWAWGDGDMTNDLLSATHAYMSAGTYSLNVKVRNRSGAAALSAIIVNVSPQSQPTRIINVSTIQELLTAYNNAVGGEHIVIPAGTVLEGEIELPARNFTDYVTIRSSAPMPDIKDRITPNYPGLVTLRGTYTNAIPLTIKNRATKIRLVGLRFEPKYVPDQYGASTYYLLQIGEAFTQTDVSQNPSKIILEHCVVNPPDDVSVVHAVLNDGYKVSIISSWLGNIRTIGGQDSQAVASYDGRGAHVYNNTFFEAASENILYGGVVPNINGLTPANIEIRRSYFSKRLSWRVYNGESHPINVKNLLETKNARRLYMEGSVLENHWDALRSQLFSMVFKSGTSPGGIGEFVPWAISEDIVLENNKISRVFGGVTTSVDVNGSFWPYMGLKPNNVLLKNNLIDDLSARWGSPFGNGRAKFLQPNNVEDLQVDHVTVVDKDRTAGEAIFFATNNNFRLKVTNSIFGLGGYGIIGSGVGTGIRALNPGTRGTTNGCVREDAASWDLSNNVMPFYGNDTSCYPSQSVYRNSYPAGYGNVGFSNLSGGDYSLAPSSVYKGTGEGGTDPGVDLSLLNQRIACTVSGITGPCMSVGNTSGVAVSGRITNSTMRGVAKVTITMTNTNGERRTAISNAFGYFAFDNVAVGDYSVGILSKRYAPQSRVVTVSRDVNNVVSFVVSLIN